MRRIGRRCRPRSRPRRLPTVVAGRRRIRRIRPSSRPRPRSTRTPCAGCANSSAATDRHAIRSAGHQVGTSLAAPSLTKTIAGRPTTACLALQARHRGAGKPHSRFDDLTHEIRSQRVEVDVVVGETGAVRHGLPVRERYLWVPPHQLVQPFVDVGEIPRILVDLLRRSPGRSGCSSSASRAAG